MLKIQSVQASLDQIDKAKLVDSDEIHSCLKTTHNSFRAALSGGPPKKTSKR